MLRAIEPRRGWNCRTISVARRAKLPGFARQCGTHPHDAKRKSHGRNNFEVIERKPLGAKLKKSPSVRSFRGQTPQPCAQYPRFRLAHVLRKTLGESCAQHVGTQTLKDAPPMLPAVPGVGRWR